MGLFDHIRCEMPLPVEWECRGGWQTKCLDCSMDTYTINAYGQLIQHWSTGDFDMEFHGDLEFHDYDRERGRIEITARFTEGRVVRMWYEWEPPHDRPEAKPPRALSEDTPTLRDKTEKTA